MSQVGNPDYFPEQKMNADVLTFFNENCSNDNHLKDLLRDHSVTHVQALEYLYKTYNRNESWEDFSRRLVNYDLFDPDYRSDPEGILRRSLSVMRKTFMSSTEIQTRTILATKFANTLINEDVGEFIQTQVIKGAAYEKIVNLISESFKINLSSSTIANYIHVNELTSSTDIAEIRTKNIKKLFDQGYPYEEIAEILNYKTNTVLVNLREYGIYHSIRWQDNPEYLKRIGYFRHMHLNDEQIVNLISEELGLEKPFNKNTLRSLAFTYPEHIPSKDILETRILKRREYKVKNLYNQGVTRSGIMSELGLSYGVLHTTITKLIESGEIEYKTLNWNKPLEELGSLSPNNVLDDLLKLNPQLRVNELVGLFKQKMLEFELNLDISERALVVNVSRRLKRFKEEG